MREAAKLSGMPVDNVTEIPADIKAEPRGTVQHIAAGNHRYLVKRSGSPDVVASSDWKSAAQAIGAPFESIAEIPETLYPR